MPSPKGLDACLGSAGSTSLFLRVQEYLITGTGSQWCGRRVPHTEVGPGLWGSPDSSHPDPLPAPIPLHGCAHIPRSQLQRQYRCIPATNRFVPRVFAFGFPRSPSANTTLAPVSAPSSSAKPWASPQSRLPQPSSAERASLSCAHE